MKANKNMHEIFHCKVCDYKCSKRFCWNQHLNTAKHNNAKNGLIKANKEYVCDICCVTFVHQSSLCRHKKTCKYAKNDKNEEIEVNKGELLDKELMTALIKQNNELIELIKNNNTTNNINNINNNMNSNNKSFNLNLFLNETCKNAMNIMDFANSIQPKLTDLENIGELGYVDGISKIIIDNLKLLDISERHVHCSDFKRDVIYVRDSNKWEKDDNALAKIKKVIHCVTNKNISLISEWKKLNPDCYNSDSIKSTKINKMIMEVMETDPIKRDKIIKNIAKQVTINKN